MQWHHPHAALRHEGEFLPVRRQHTAAWIAGDLDLSEGRLGVELGQRAVEVGQPRPCYGNFIAMLRIVLDYPLIGLLRLHPAELLVAEADMQLRSCPYGPVVGKLLQDPPEQIDGGLQVTLDLLLVEPGLVQFLGALLGVGHGHCSYEERQAPYANPKRFHDRRSSTSRVRRQPTAPVPTLL